MEYEKPIYKDMQLNDWKFLNFKEYANTIEIMKGYDYFFYINERFPAEGNTITVPKEKYPNFIESDQEISLLHFHEKFRGRTSHALVCTQFLCALHIHLGGDLELSKNEISKFYDTFSLKALIKSNDSATLFFKKYLI